MKFPRAFALLAALTLVPIAAGAEDGGTRAALTPLPRPTSTALPPADANVVAELDAWLAKLTGADAEGRKQAVANLAEASPRLVPAVAKKLGELRKANRDAMAVALASARKKPSGAPDDDDAPKKKRPGEPDKSDWFDKLMAAPHPEQSAWRDLASLLGMSRLLEHIGSAAAAREIVALYPTFGELVRIDVQRTLERLGERAVAALIDARHADDKKLRAWAARQLDVLGKTVPGEAVQTSDNEVLADVLRAYGRAKDIDAARVIVSFANSDRAQVRDAAREAVGMLAENGLWQLRESYESLIGKKPPDEWNWERTAMELFAAYDRSRLAEVYALLDDGLAARKADKLDDMAKAFDAVLARAPTLDRRSEMVAGYVAYAHSLEDRDRPRALAYLRKAQRLDPAAAEANAIGADVAFLDAEDLASRGVVDVSLYKRALELDPTNARARAKLTALEQQSEDRDVSLRRYAGAAAIGIAALLGAIVLFLRRRLGDAPA